jgi:hypothetical protein
MYYPNKTIPIPPIPQTLRRNSAVPPTISRPQTNNNNLLDRIALALANQNGTTIAVDYQQQPTRFRGAAGPSVSDAYNIDVAGHGGGAGAGAGHGYRYTGSTSVAQQQQQHQQHQHQQHQHQHQQHQQHQHHQPQHHQHHQHQRQQRQQSHHRQQSQQQQWQHQQQQQHHQRQRQQPQPFHQPQQHHQHHQHHQHQQQQQQQQQQQAIQIYNIGPTDCSSTGIGAGGGAGHGFGGGAGYKGASGPPIPLYYIVTNIQASAGDRGGAGASGGSNSGGAGNGSNINDRSNHNANIKKTPKKRYFSQFCRFIYSRLMSLNRYNCSSNKYEDTIVGLKKQSEEAQVTIADLQSELQNSTNSYNNVQNELKRTKTELDLKTKEESAKPARRQVKIDALNKPGNPLTTQKLLTKLNEGNEANNLLFNANINILKNRSKGRTRDKDKIVFKDNSSSTTINFHIPDSVQLEADQVMCLISQTKHPLNEMEYTLVKSSDNKWDVRFYKAHLLNQWILSKFEQPGSRLQPELLCPITRLPIFNKNAFSAYKTLSSCVSNRAQQRQQTEPDLSIQYFLSNIFGTRQPSTQR